MEKIDLQSSQRKGNSALRQLRIARLAKGLPFMVNSNALPSKQCYLEYSDGSIVLAGINNETDRDFTIIRELKNSEKVLVRKRFRLL